MISNEMIFDEDKYGSREDMWHDILTVTKALTHNGYAVMTQYEDCGIYTVEYSHSRANADEFGSERFMKVTADEAEAVEKMREEEL